MENLKVRTEKNEDQQKVDGVHYYSRFCFQHELTAKIETPYASKAFAGLEGSRLTIVRFK